MAASWLEQAFLRLVGPSPLWQGLAGGIVIAALNMLGACLILIWRRPSERFLNVSLAFAAGVMLTASFTSLILPGIQTAGVVPVIIGMVLGIVGIDLSDHLIPHLHPLKGREGLDTTRLQAVWLFILAITIHNIPEGLAVAVSALNAGMGSSFYAGVVSLRSGLVEIPLALIGAWAVQLAQPVLPYAMGFAAGAMLYVISDEIVPETHRSGHERAATLGTLAGAIAMLYLDLSLV